MYWSPDNVLRLSAPEVIAIIIWAAGIGAVVIALIGRRLSFSYALIAITLAVVVPVVGSIGSIVLVALLWRKGSSQPRVN